MSNNTVRLAIIKTSVNDSPRTKLRSDSYLSFIENEKVSKDKDTNFIRAIMPSDRQLAKAKEMKPVKEQTDIDMEVSKVLSKGRCSLA